MTIKPVAPIHPPSANAFSGLRGASRLAIDAVAGVTDIVEDLHHSIAGAAPIAGKAPVGRTTGITGLVYRSVRGVTRAVGFGLDAVPGQLTPLLRHNAPSPRGVPKDANLAGLGRRALQVNQRPQRESIPCMLPQQFTHRRLP